VRIPVGPVIPSSGIRRNPSSGIWDVFIPVMIGFQLCTCTNSENGEFLVYEYGRFKALENRRFAPMENGECLALA
jgi:hypothetical protein